MDGIGAVVEVALGTASHDVIPNPLGREHRLRQIVEAEVGVQRLGNIQVFKHLDCADAKPLLHIGCGRVLDQREDAVAHRVFALIDKEAVLYDNAPLLAGEQVGHAPLFAPAFDVVELLAVAGAFGAVVQPGKDRVLLFERAVHARVSFVGFLEALCGFVGIPPIVLRERLDLLVGHPLLVDEPLQRIAGPAIHRVDFAAEGARKDLEQVNVAGRNDLFPLWLALRLAALLVEFPVTHARHTIARAHDVDALERRNDGALNVQLRRRHEEVV